MVFLGSRLFLYLYFAAFVFSGTAAVRLSVDEVLPATRFRGFAGSSDGTGTTDLLVVDPPRPLPAWVSHHPSLKKLLTVDMLETYIPQADPSKRDHSPELGHHRESSPEESIVPQKDSSGRADKLFMQEHGRLAALANGDGGRTAKVVFVGNSVTLRLSGRGVKLDDLSGDTPSY